MARLFEEGWINPAGLIGSGIRRDTSPKRGFEFVDPGISTDQLNLIFNF